ncbi:PolC-type DNA polymerase III [uncultured Corynebacterium sp.]|uniref:3'-5' exonuclease n=1 Tax=uncultured Corynebacterium sp. TaxID=159447 RepID=UPI0025FE3D51|nr:3'-5' exonuclease [uncultured Corynebacterium sp.]
MTPSPAREDLPGILLRALRDCVIVDCETTGLDPAVDRIIEVAALRIRVGRPVAVFHRLVDPGRPLPGIIVSLTGLTDARVRGAPPVEEILGDLSEFLAGHTVVGHNVDFDLAFINAEISGAHRAARSVSPTVCTAESARALIPRSRVGRYSLTTLAEVLALDHRPVHRSVSDVLATLDLLHHLCTVSGAETSGPTAAHDPVLTGRAFLPAE